MTAIHGPGYPCSTCGRVMHDTDEGRRVTLGSRSIVVCRAVCEPRMQTAARATKSIVATGLRALIDQRLPGVLPALRKAYDAWHAAERESDVYPHREH